MLEVFVDMLAGHISSQALHENAFWFLHTQIQTHLRGIYCPQNLDPCRVAAKWLGQVDKIYEKFCDACRPDRSTFGTGICIRLSEREVAVTALCMLSWENPDEMEIWRVRRHGLL